MPSRRSVKNRSGEVETGSQPSPRPKRTSNRTSDISAPAGQSHSTMIVDNQESSSKNNGNPEAIAEDDICPICQLLLCHPVTTLCNHTLCAYCMATWADVSVVTQMQIVDIDEEVVPFNAVSGLEARCPMCRTQTSASRDHARAADLESRYSKAYAERLAEEDADGANSEASQIQTLTLSIGNRHRLVAPRSDTSNQHEWTFFVRPSRTDIIEEVHIHLHRTFRPSRIIRSRPPYEVTRLGWGYFTIVAYVMLKPGYSWVSEDARDSPDGAEKGILGLDWPLDFSRFDGKGCMGRLRLKVRNQRDWKDISDEEEEDEREWSRVVRQYQTDGIYVPDEEM